MRKAVALKNNLILAERFKSVEALDEISLSNRLDLLKDLAQTLLSEVEALSTTRAPSIERGINFYEEVERFERDLIERALKRTGGHQTRAAQLLSINLTTLNQKIKRYRIELPTSKF